MFSSIFFAILVFQHLYVVDQWIIYDHLWLLTYLYISYQKWNHGFLSTQNRKRLTFVKTKTREISRKKGVPFVVTYHLGFRGLSYMNDEVKKTFTLSPLISFRNSRKTSSYVVRTKLYRQRTLESYKYNKGLCEVCDVFLRLMHYLALLQMRILILIESWTKMIKVSCSLLASCKICNEE